MIGATDNEAMLGLWRELGTASEPNAFPMMGVHLAVMFGGSHELLR